MGAVWLGRDESLGREVALKRIGLLPGADSIDLARAEREARLSARLNHPHVVTVFDVVVDPGTGAHWLVMEYVEGTNLAELVRDEGGLSPDVAAPLLGQAADALVAAHAAGIVHRDVKPSNILVDRFRQVKLTDFGIARIAGDPTLTQTGLVTGSPAYLAPEVATGSPSNEASDVWSLGATLFHALSGRPPYDAGGHVLGGLYRLVHEEPPRLADAGWLGPLLEATMVRDPAGRWPMVQVRDYLTGRVDPWTVSTPSGPVRGGAVEDPTSTRELRAARDESPPPRPARAARAPSRPVRRGLLTGLVALVVALGLAAVLFAVLRDDGKGSGTATPSPSATPSQTASSRAPQPTAAGMESFVNGYVAALAANPDAAWRMLSPRFQRESGGLAKYRTFWSGVGRGQILSIDADPRTLVVSYRVRFENFGTGRRPTVLQLVFERGRYLIDGELT
jgi:serine/threonine protein kinase